ncbi:hypothetical protein Cfor_09057 [Coptotermes formosanus]|uniref:Fibrinogen C-terminal domain-containing protein n=1 Tax=Coptotermes formosanus TaxID=36987 RepID=A0A6L2PAS9_COPFO|nr:hypothetical protein Cfor_09057 [Coptotermes formosanus]
MTVNVETRGEDTEQVMQFLIKRITLKHAIQRRDDFGEPRENFNRDWSDYKNGFGDPAKEFWLGNENIYMLTNNEDYMLRVELEDFEGNKRYAQYSHFKIYSEAEYYKLEIDGYEGNAGDSLNDPWYGSNNSPFSTYNRDNDRSSLNCASMLKGGWWWKSCGRGLNGLYLNDPQDLTARQGMDYSKNVEHLEIIL